MNKILLACFIICLSACQLLKKSELVNNLKKDPITIYADFKFNEGRLIGSKTKTKINILKDSILISARMFLGMELVNIQITNEQIYIDIRGSLIPIQIIRGPFIKGTSLLANE